MPETDSFSIVADRIQQLMQQRQQYADALARIDQTLEQIKVLLESGGKAHGFPALRSPVSRPSSKSASSPGRRSPSGITGNQLILSFIQDKGSAVTREIVQHWKNEGRKGRPMKLLGILVQKKMLKRTPLVGQRGSEYSLTAATFSAARNAPAFTKRAGKRGKYGLTAGQLILNFVGASKNPTTRDIAQHWKREGRKGKADNALGILVKAKKLQRKKLEGQKGSTYSLA